MKNCTVQETTKRYYTQLNRALNHPKPEVKCMALEQLERYTINNDEQLLAELCNELDLFHTIIKLIGDNDLGVAKIAGRIITQIGMTPFGLMRLIKKPTLDFCLEMLEKPEVIRLRFYEVRKIIIFYHVMNIDNKNRMPASKLLLS